MHHHHHHYRRDDDSSMVMHQQEANRGASDARSLEIFGITFYGHQTNHQKRRK
jgi:hypothetical protein